MIKISSIDEFISELDNNKPADYAKVVKALDLDPELFKRYATWKESCYTRNCLGKTADYELILLCWDEGAETPIHGHGGEDCWVYQLSGTVEEIRYRELEENVLEASHKLCLQPGKLTYMNDDMGYHSIRNIGAGRAMTLHIYASPISFCKVYNEESNDFAIKELFYHTYKGEPFQVSKA